MLNGGKDRAHGEIAYSTSMIIRDGSGNQLRSAYPSLADFMAKSIIASSPQAKIDNMKAMAAGGVGVDKDGNIKPWWHGTPNGKAMMDSNVIFRNSEDGLFGPAAYLIDQPLIADRYANSATDAVSDFIEKNGKSLRFTRQEMLRHLAVMRDMHYKKLPEMASANSDGASSYYAQFNDEIRSRVSAIEGIDKTLAAYGVEVQPVVLPMVVRVKIGRAHV